MVDIAKKVNKKSELLEAGESCVAATGILKAGQFNTSVAAGAIGGIVGHARVVGLGNLASHSGSRSNGCGNQHVTPTPIAASRHSVTHVVDGVQHATNLGHRPRISPRFRRDIVRNCAANASHLVIQPTAAILPRFVAEEIPEIGHITPC